MRIAVAIASGVLALVAATSLAAAVSLAGAPFTVVEDFGGRTATVSAYADEAGEFAVLSSERDKRALLPQRVWLGLFDATGRPKGVRNEIFDGRGAPAESYALGSGWLPLKRKASFVAWSTPRAAGAPNETGGLSGRLVGKKTPVGEAFSIDEASPLELVGGSVVELNDGRGLAVWRSGYGVGAEVGARFVSTGGKLSRRSIDLTDDRGRFYRIVNYRDGFIVQLQRYYGSSTSDLAQIYDGSGRKAGAKKVLIDKLRDGSDQPRVVGLGDGTILFTRLIDEETSRRLLVRRFDGSWNEKGRAVTLLTGLSYAMDIVALPGEDFLVGALVKHGASGEVMEFSRFTPQLAKVGASVRIDFGSGLLWQIVPLKTGAALVLYRKGDQLVGQLLKP